MRENAYLYSSKEKTKLFQIYFLNTDYVTLSRKSKWKWQWQWQYQFFNLSKFPQENRKTRWQNQKKIHGQHLQHNQVAKSLQGGNKQPQPQRAVLYQGLCRRKQKEMGVSVRPENRKSPKEPRENHWKTWWALLGTAVETEKGACCPMQQRVSTTILSKVWKGLKQSGPHELLKTTR